MNKELLKQCYLFKEMNPEELTKLEAALSLKNFNRGDRIFSQGDEAEALYLIKAGSVRVLQKGKKGDRIEIALLPAGSHFGEMAFLDEEKRSATIESVDQTEVLRIDYEKLRSVLMENKVIAIKFLKAMALFLCDRLRATTNDLSFARELNLTHF